MTKPSVMNDLPEWPGWDIMNDYLLTSTRAKYGKDSSNYLIMLMEFGCRRNEAVQIRTEQVHYNSEAIVVKRVPVTKYRSAKVRDIIIIRDEKNPWSEPFLDYLAGVNHEYLFPARTKQYRTIIPSKHTTGRTVYSRISEIDSSLLLEDVESRDIMWPHGIRGLKASMLVEERGFTVQMLMKWFEWTHPGMAIHYTRTRDLAKAMGIVNLP